MSANFLTFNIPLRHEKQLIGENCYNQYEKLLKKHFRISFLICFFAYRMYFTIKYLT